MTNLDDRTIALDRLNQRADRLLRAFYSAVFASNYGRAQAITEALKSLELQMVELRYLGRSIDIYTFKNWGKFIDNTTAPPVASVAVKKARAPRTKKAAS